MTEYRNTHKELEMAREQANYFEGRVNQLLDTVKKVEHERDQALYQADYYVDAAERMADERDTCLAAIREFVAVGEATLRIFGEVGERLISIARNEID